jgi:hypothetical protein
MALRKREKKIDKRNKNLICTLIQRLMGNLMASLSLLLSMAKMANTKI